MKKSFSNYLSIILPNKKINLFTIFIIVLGIISGSIFLVILSDSDKEIVVSKISGFINNINTNNVNNFKAFKDSFISNSIYIILVWVLGASMIGIIFNIFLTYLRGFIAGFSISAFILIYKYKGIVASIIYVFPTTIINLLITILIGVYSFNFTLMLYRSLFNKTNNIILKSNIKKYFVVLLISIGLVILSSLSEAFLFPSLMKLVIKLFI